MSIVGIGVDVVGVERVKRMMEKFKERFVKRFFGVDEEIPKVVERIAGRIAAKEAVMKLLEGRSGLKWSDIQISGGGREPPKVKLCGVALAVARKLSIKRVHLSISNEKGVAVAIAVGER